MGYHNKRINRACRLLVVRSFLSTEINMSCNLLTINCKKRKVLSWHIHWSANTRLQVTLERFTLQHFHFYELNVHCPVPVLHKICICYQMFLLNTTSDPAILLKQSVTRFFSLVCPYMYLQIHEHRKDCIYLFLVLPVKHQEEHVRATSLIQNTIQNIATCQQLWRCSWIPAHFGRTKVLWEIRVSRTKAAVNTQQSLTTLPIHSLNTKICDNMFKNKLDIKYIKAIKQHTEMVICNLQNRY